MLTRYFLTPCPRPGSLFRLFQIQSVQNSLLEQHVPKNGICRPASHRGTATRTSNKTVRAVAGRSRSPGQCDLTNAIAAATCRLMDDRLRDNRAGDRKKPDSKEGVAVVAAEVPKGNAPEQLSYPWNNPERPLFQKEEKRNQVTYDQPIRHFRGRTSSSSASTSKHLPSVTHILRETMPVEQKLALERWRAGMLEKLGQAGFDEWQRRTFARGHALHAAVEQHLLRGGGDDGDDQAWRELAVGDDPVSLNHLQSLGPVLKHFSRPFALESHVEHPDWKYHGYADCVAVYKRTRLVLIDWKTSEREKRTLQSTYDNPLQVAAYLGAFNRDPKYAKARLDRGLIVLAYNDGRPAQLLPMNERALDRYWREWLRRLDVYRRMRIYDEARR